MPQFLTDEWIEAARKIRADLADQLPASNAPARINLNVTGVPFGDTVEAHIDTTTNIDMDLGHLDNVDATMTLGYDLARAILVDGKVDQAVQAYMGGQLKVEGDLMKVMGLQTQLQSPDLKPLQERFGEITD